MVSETEIRSTAIDRKQDVTEVYTDEKIEAIAIRLRSDKAISLQRYTSLSNKYFNKAFSARLFPIPKKIVGDIIDFYNPYLTSSVIMQLN